MSEYQIGTQCVHAGYTPGNGEPRNIPIVQSTTFRYETSEAMGKLFDLEESGYFYTRLQNPTNDHLRSGGRDRRHADLLRPGRLLLLHF